MMELLDFLLFQAESNGWINQAMINHHEETIPQSKVQSKTVNAMKIDDKLNDLKSTFSLHIQYINIMVRDGSKN